MDAKCKYSHLTPINALILLYSTDGPCRNYLLHMYTFTCRFISLFASLRFVKVHVLPVDSSRPCTYYCCKAQEPQSLLSFNEGFRIPLSAGGPGAHALQLNLCAVGPLAQEELLVRLTFTPNIMLILEFVMKHFVLNKRILGAVLDPVVHKVAKIALSL